MAGGAVGASVGVGVAAGLGVTVGAGDAVAAGDAVGTGVDVTAGVDVGVGVADAVGGGATIGAGVGVGCGLDGGAAVEVGAAVTVAVEAALAVGAAVGLLVGVMVGEATGTTATAGVAEAATAETAMKMRDAERVVISAFFAPPPPISSVALAPTWCGPRRAPVGTENVVEKLPLPLVWTEGMPVALASQVSCTTEWPKPVPATVMTVPLTPDVGERLSPAAVGEFEAKTALPIGIAIRPNSVATRRMPRISSSRANPCPDPIGRGWAGTVAIPAVHVVLPLRTEPPAAIVFSSIR